MRFDILKWVKILRWIAIIFAAITLLSLFSVFLLTRWPYFAELVKCQNNLKALYDATQRYRATHEDQYPASLEDLRKDYLKSTDVLHCPLETNADGKSNYIYKPPGENAKDTDILIACDNHQISSRMEPIRVYITVAGNPGMKPLSELEENDTPAEPESERVEPETPQPEPEKKPAKGDELEIL